MTGITEFFNYAKVNRQSEASPLKCVVSLGTGEFDLS